MDTGEESRSLGLSDMCIHPRCSPGKFSSRSLQGRGLGAGVLGVGLVLAEGISQFEHSLSTFFSQQFLQFESRLQRDDAAVVTLARTNNFTASGTPLGPAVYEKYGPMDVAISFGLIQRIEDLSSVFAAGCTSGNCTSPSSDGSSFLSLGIRHLCEDTTSYVRRQNIAYNRNVTRTWITVSGNRTDYRNISIEDALAPIQVSATQVNITDDSVKETLVSKNAILRTSLDAIEHSTDFEDFQQMMYAFRLAPDCLLRNGSLQAWTGSKNPQRGTIRFYRPEGAITSQRPTRPERLSLGRTASKGHAGTQEETCGIPQPVCGFNGNGSHFLL
ncbi:uncharacterized protein M421DRAFT_392459 [Didymella exigua CBS 183.55]|uniref:Uncharacterized protein n=1 Tax=Didymella exigua CBS 183.55 TaxID=1150837 RepID=A0A6A5RJ72_9PLEO|nr:uncharacterized protein M421DRAFT_392459 [Didymella exigua CBS 183.55]KAF1927862.1 hypothetical protein M421DRAFT_392459 [Didymella exigua CBS 183.55]